MTVDLVEVLRGQADQVRDDVHGVHLELLQLRWRPSRDDSVVVDGVRVKVEQQCPQETLLHHDVVSLNVALSMTDRKNLSPKKLFKLEVLVGDVEDWLVLVSVHLIKDSVGDHLLQNALLTVLIQEELVAFRAGDNVVDEHTDLVAKALVILLVAASEYHLEGCLQGWDHLWVNGELTDRLIASNFDQVPEGLNRQRDDVRAEVLGLTDDANQVPAYTLHNDLVGDGLKQADSCNGLQDRDHGVN